MSLNVILITIDCLRADHVGSLGYARPTTPHIDALARRGTIFAQALSNGPKTSASFPSILTSTYPLMYGGTAYLAEDRTSIAEVLKNHGYSTVAFHSNPFLSSSYGYNKGFDTFWDSIQETPQLSRLARRIRSPISPHSLPYRILRRIHRFFDLWNVTSTFAPAEVINRETFHWLERASDRFFLWLHYMDAHYPYIPPRQYREKFHLRPLSGRAMADLFTRMVEDPTLISAEEIDTLIDLYDAEIRHVDESVGVLLDKLERLEIADDSLIVITSDHGEEFGEHGDFSHATTVSSQRSVKLYDELLRVPLIIYNPRLPGHKSKVGTLVSLIDLAPTIVDILGIEKPDGWLGESLLSLILGDERERAGGVISEYEYKLQPEGERITHASYRTERWKFIFDGRDGEHKLFDLQKDPCELENLYERAREIAVELEAQVREHLWRVSMTGEALKEADVEEEVMDRLRGLGYLS